MFHVHVPMFFRIKGSLIVRGGPDTTHTSPQHSCSLPAASLQQVQPGRGPSLDRKTPAPRNGQDSPRLPQDPTKIPPRPPRRHQDLPRPQQDPTKTLAKTFRDLILSFRNLQHTLSCPRKMCISACSRFARQSFLRSP
jgi:hypothetical protein